MLRAPHRTTFLSGAGRHNLRGHSFIVSPLSKIIIIGGNHNHLQKESFNVKLTEIAKAEAILNRADQIQQEMVPIKRNY